MRGKVAPARVDEQLIYPRLDHLCHDWILLRLITPVGVPVTDRTGQGRTERDRTGQNRAGQGRTGQDSGGLS